MRFLRRISLLCGAMMMLASPAIANDTVKWKLAMTWPSTLTPFASSVQKFAQNVSDMTGGKFIIKVDGKEKHKAALGILDMVQGGQYEMGHRASYYWKGKDITTVFSPRLLLG